VDIKVKRLTETAKMPTKAHKTDACFDLYVDEPNSTYSDYEKNPDTMKLKFVSDIPGIKIEPHSTVKLHSGISTEIPSGYFCAVFPRSGLGIKQNLRLPNGTGIIDADYRGEWIIALFNDSDEQRIIHHGDRVAQFAVLPVPKVNLVEVDELTDTERGDGGFGSTGVK